MFPYAVRDPLDSDESDLRLDDNSIIPATHSLSTYCLPLSHILNMKQTLRSFGKRVRELRLASGLSQEELAELAGLHRTYIGGIERGERNIGIANIFRLAQALKVPPGAFFDDLGSDNST